MTIARADEAVEFMAALEVCDPTAVSAAGGWTTHDVAAHVAGTHAEVSRHLEPFLAGRPVPATRSFAEREAPLRALPFGELLAVLDRDEHRMRARLNEALEHDPTAAIPWTGRTMAVHSFIPHLRNEHALHRWDLVGDDAVSARLLGSHDLVDHSVTELGEILTRAGRRLHPSPGDLTVALRTPHERDLHVVASADTAYLTWAATDDAVPHIDFDAAARHLVIWGRRPDDRGRIRSHLTADALDRVHRLLAGY